MWTLRVTEGPEAPTGPVLVLDDNGAVDSQGDCVACCIRYLQRKGLREVTFELSVDGELTPIPNLSLAALLFDFCSAEGISVADLESHNSWGAPGHVTGAGVPLPNRAARRKARASARRLKKLRERRRRKHGPLEVEAGPPQGPSGSILPTVH